MNVVYIASDTMLVFKCAGNGRKQGKKGKKFPQVCRWLTIGKPGEIGPARPRYADGRGHRQTNHKFADGRDHRQKNS